MRAAAGVLGLVLAAALAGCGDDGPGGLGDEDTHVVEVRGARTAFTVDVSEEWGITSLDDTSVCDSPRYRLGPLVIEAIPADCTEAGENSEIGNGKHGVYRTLDDVPEPKDVETFETGLGRAEVFLQRYFECTNECDDWDEPVAIIDVDDPVDPAYPTLVVRAQQDDLTRDELEDVLATLEKPYEPGSG